MHTTAVLRRWLFTVPARLVRSGSLGVRALIEIRVGGGRGIRTPGSVAASAVFKLSH